MNNQIIARNTQVTTAHTTGEIHKTGLVNILGVSPLIIRRVLSGVVLAVTVVASIGPAEALTPEDEAFVRQYFAAHPENQSVDLFECHRYDSGA